MSFSNWIKWSEAKNKRKVPWKPGLYAVMLSKKNRDDERFDWQKQICFIGMVNDQKKGIRGHIERMLYSMGGKPGHRAGQEMAQKYQDLTKPDFLDRFHVAYWSFDYDVESMDPEDIMAKGRVVGMKYYSIGKFVSLYQRVPQFNREFM